MDLDRAFAPLVLAAALLAGCSIPGIPRTETLSRARVPVGTEVCTHVVQLTSTNTVNGIHRVEEATMRCDGSDYACADSDVLNCIAAVAALRARPAA